MVWIEDIRFQPDVAAKLRLKHGLTPAQVREAVALNHHEQARWDNHPVRGRRLFVTGTTADGVRLVAVLRPLDQEDGLWECATAWIME